MMLMFFGLVAVFLPTIVCLQGPIIYNNSTSYKAVEEGDSPQLECYASDNSPIKWHKSSLFTVNQNLTLPNGETSFCCGNVLKIPSITKDQRGTYVCSIENEYGSDLKYFDVSVEFAPIILETHRIDRFESKELELRCYAEFYPLAIATWTKNDIQLYPDRHHQIITSKKYDDGLNTTLIVSTESDYYGTYECSIANKLGVSIKTFKVTAPALKRDNLAE